MKRIILFFTVCLGLSVSQTTFADVSNSLRTTSKRTINTPSSVNINSNRSHSSDTKRTNNQQNKNTRTATKTNQKNVVSRTTSTQKNIKPRTNLNQQTTNSATRTSVTTRSAILQTNESQKKLSGTKASKATRSATNKKNVRATEIDTAKIANIKSANYSKCKTVYYECMDEFCANKDTNLRRCACSSRIHEFDNIKKQLDNAEDKMLDFNQRLLTVSLDKEDAAAINVASEGERAFSLKDTSSSEKLLQKITKTLNDSGDSKINNDLSAISLSLDMDTAWDNIDSLSGVATSSKNGLDLYNAARPVCVEMAREVCTDDELSIAQDGYKLTIQQDCNTVSKSYTTLYNNAMEKIHESGALLDMSRLSNYQQRNSDDILTCKKKILTQLSDNSVCGKNLYKCLDTTGEYIDPSTGQAFLSENLYKFTGLLQEPTENEKWSKIVQNEPFVNFINSKREFLKPAIQQCEDIADTVWKEFLDDALSQIKLAQNAKMEEIKQSCTTLVAECKTQALTDLAEFDSRSLSVFNVTADKTANEMCSKIQNSCVSLMGDYSSDWGSGMRDIATDITYQSVIDTCTQVGRDCIIQKCNGASGNFALCKSTTAENRMAILKREACWNEVLNCVNGADNLENMDPGAPLLSGYYNNNSCGSANQKACAIAQQIWGNCDMDNQSTPLSNATSNKIISGSSLLSWLATNTGTQTRADSCNTYPCPMNFELTANGTCQQVIANQTGDCETATNYNQIIHVTSDLTNHCTYGKRDMFGNCCEQDVTERITNIADDKLCAPGTGYHALRLVTETCNSYDPYYCPDYGDHTTPRQISVYCITTDNSITYTDNAQGYTVTYTCNGTWVLVDQYGNYFNVDGQSDAPTMTYNDNTCNNHSCPCSTINSCTYTYSNSWEWLDNNNYACPTVTSPQVPTDNEFTITYQ